MAEKFDPTPEQRKAGLAHLVEEMERLLLSACALGKTPDQASFQGQMLGDALFLHIRVLLEFFQRGSRYIFNGVELDTILASDYGFQTSNVHGGRSIWERLNKEYAHLSYGRTDAPWDMQLLVPLLDRCRKFAETVISGANQPLVAGDEKQLKRWLQVHAECAAITIEPPSP